MEFRFLLSLDLEFAVEWRELRRNQPVAADYDTVEDFLSQLKWEVFSRWPLHQLPPVAEHCVLWLTLLYHLLPGPLRSWTGVWTVYKPDEEYPTFFKDGHWQPALVGGGPRGNLKSSKGSKRSSKGPKKNSVAAESNQKPSELTAAEATILLYIS